MGFFDKVKNMFTEEIEDDVKVEQIKKEVTQVPIESPSAKTDDYTDRMINSFDFKEEEKFNKPVFFDDNDFKDLNHIKKVEEKKEPKASNDFYNIKSQKIKEEEVKKVFKPTPIISPVYGVLDKNYHKEDIVSRRDNGDIQDDNNVSIETIRNKAYGTLEEELENTLFGNNSILFKHAEIEKEEVETEKEINNEPLELNEDTLSDLTDEVSKDLDELLVKKEKYDDGTVDDSEDLLEFIDSTLYHEGEE